MEEDEVIEVVQPGAARLNASRSGRVSVPPRRLEEEFAEAALRKGLKPTVGNRKTLFEHAKGTSEGGSKTNDQFTAILQAIQDQGNTTKQRLDRHEKLIEQYGVVIEKQWTAITQQGTLLEKHISETRAEFIAMREDHAAFAQAVNERLDTFTARLEALTSLFNQLRTEVSTTTTSYADALKTGLPLSAAAMTSAATSQGTPITQICSINPSSSASQQGTASSPHVVIDFSTVERSSTIANEKPGAVRRRIDEALKDHVVTKEIKCQGISRNARDSNKYKVYFKDEKAVQTVRQNDGWLKGYFRGARLQAEQWHPIRVDSVYKGAVLKDMGGNEVKEEATQMVAEENDVQVHKIQWLSKPDRSKIHGSMVLYLARRQDAEKLLRDGRVEVDGETAFARPYERRTGPMRCFKCHQFNHVAAQCPSPQPVCSRCAGAGHTHRECTNDRVKCATCGGLHSTFDPSCRLYKAACEKLVPRQS
jgi:hypothetical protein